MADPKPGIVANCSTGDVRQQTPEELAADIAGRVVVAPEVISRMQARLALAMSGHLAVLDAYASDPSTPAVHRIYIQDSTQWDRTHPMVLQLAAALYGWAPDDVAAWFTQAAAIV